MPDLTRNGIMQKSNKRWLLTTNGHFGGGFFGTGGMSWIVVSFGTPPLCGSLELLLTDPLCS